MSKPKAKLVRIDCPVCGVWMKPERAVRHPQMPQLPAWWTCNMCHGVFMLQNTHNYTPKQKRFILQNLRLSA